MTQEIVTTENTDNNLTENPPETKSKRVELCSNCGVELNGQFCHVCGQSSKSVIKFFGDVLKELLDDAVGYDSRLKHSIFPLLFKPGRISLDYVKGKRFHYVLPFRLYLITSLILILLVKAVVTTEDINFNDVIVDDSSLQVPIGVKEEVNEALKKAKESQDNSGVKESGVKELIGSAIADNQIEEIDKVAEEYSSGENKTKTVERKINEKNFNVTVSDGNSLHWDNDKKELIGIENLNNGLIKSFFEEINPKLKHWFKNPEPLMDSFFEALPYMMFIILPIFALFLKLFYFFSKRYYTEHLIFLLHNHSFIYVILMMEIILDFSADKLSTGESWLAQSSASVFSLISTLLSYWIIVYVFLAMKRFYRQGWGMTISKTFALGFIYFMMLSFGFMMTLAAGAYQA